MFSDSSYHGRGVPASNIKEILVEFDSTFLVEEAVPIGNEFSSADKV